jgi:hypothetical protein
VAKAAFAEPLARIGRLLQQRREDKDKIYSLHAPEVECIGKSLPPRRRGARRMPGSSSA